MASINQKYDFTVRRAPTHARLDAYLAARFKKFSRTFFQKLIKEGQVSINGSPAKRHQEIRIGDQVHLIMELPERVSKVQPEELPLDILFEDEKIIVVNKPAGMVLHPAKGNWHGTLISAVMHHCQDPNCIGGPTRPGIVHRLDRETSGVVILGKDAGVLPHLARQFERRVVKKTYRAITEGTFKSNEGTIDLPLGRHVFQRFKFAVRPDNGKVSITHYRVIEKFEGYSFVELEPHTGRSHQIRVHLASAGCPVLCDRLYGHRVALYKGDLAGNVFATGGDPLINRHALHAFRLSIKHPVANKRLEFVAPLPSDMSDTLNELRELKALS